ncbi:SulP family inorganic anion transporter [Pseudomonas auratipiscis]|uniref:SulP family inorganic anion transporter n=1 Tax=Pseudomonas auratipiscis TaxID=3115853 RepID=A0AB35WU99_9PSED|nr:MULTISPECIES: SulP family inorganic anion transporter [unclassified Pseudomonas]MEE1867780.1 SulP family inorganic anion transporter [Pseudomonas sp. 120P]MEE1960356.1 SulP family inorganic anion transporter [Pseudomonas sp. 119P]
MKTTSLRADVLAGLTTSFALVPECIAFALVAHLNPLMGLYGAFIICTLTALLGGRPGMISGAAGSMAVVIVALVVQHGVQYLLATVLLGGLIMIVFGVLRLGKLVRMVPYSVMLGFVNGLAIIIALAQLEHFKHDGVWLSGSTLYLMIGLVALTMAIVYVLPRLTRSVPPALVAILGVGAGVYLLDLPTHTLGDLAHIAGGLPALSWPDIPWTLETLQIIAPYAILMALVGLLETLLTLNLTDEITESRGYPNRECVALGVANMTSGMFGGMGGCAMIGQTAINLSSGGRGRLSGVVAGVMILLFVLFLSPLIERIPLAALVGVMFVVSQQTFSWASLRVLHKVPVNDMLAIIAVTVVTVLTDLATAVLIGIVIAAINFAWQQARELYADSHLESDGSKLYRVHGTLFFASTTPFLNQFDPVNDPAQVTLDCQHLNFVDYSAIAALKTLRERYSNNGKHLRVVHLSERCKQLLKRTDLHYG